MKSYDVLVIKGNINDSVLKRINEHVKTTSADVLYLVLDTFGGAPDVGFRIMSLLDITYKKIYVVVPNRAMSTGTLMALGGDAIYMMPSASLGPLDLQIEHPGDGSWISTLDVRDTMKTIISHTEIAAKRLYEQTYAEFGLSKTAAAKIANECAVRLISPIVNKIDPYHLHKSFRSAEVGAKYGAALLKTRMMKGREDLADLIGAHLANNYETHSYAITLAEAKGLLALDAHDLAGLKEWVKIEPVYNKISQGVRYTTISDTSQSAARAPATKRQNKIATKEGDR